MIINIKLTFNDYFLTLAPDLLTLYKANFS